jgi:hypothetical protein
MHEILRGKGIQVRLFTIGKGARGIDPYRLPVYEPFRVGIPSLENRIGPGYGLLITGAQAEPKDENKEM